MTDPPSSPVVPDVSARIALLEQQLAARDALLHTIFEAVPYIIFVFDVADDGTLSQRALNQHGARAMGVSVAAMLGQRLADVVPPVPLAAIQARVQACIDAGTSIDFEEHLEFAAGDIWTNTIYTPVFTADGRITQIVGTAFDITDAKRREQAAREEQAAIIAAQEQTLNALSTPLLTLGNKVVLLPLIGAIDTRRAQQILDTLLQGISIHQAAMVILDITGVEIVDTQVANTLVQATQAARLLGAQVTVTGIRPEVAQTLVSLNVSLQGMLTHGALEQGIAAAFQRTVAD